MSEKKHILENEPHVGIGTAQGEAESMIKYAEEEPDLAEGKHGVSQGETSDRPTEYTIESLHRIPDIDQEDTVGADDPEVSGVYTLPE